MKKMYDNNMSRGIYASTKIKTTIIIILPIFQQLENNCLIGNHTASVYFDKYCQKN